ncbi:PRC-barrel domain-containing protein [Paracoccus sp. Z330]|uniref:PRC-barrel domain-containing protein n=1 Tax=Paracoccus onchidii TaxID=3017813 RepID=A0ABT4ZJ80_9RHOB|nr:PRC-barrel domain-containing protein [Paracoccus onchidii]MDB6179426.1 PRC-barrel domain-containing protein [Paracoccus onchidii]
MRKLLLTTAFVLPLAAGQIHAQDTAPQPAEAETTPMATDPAATDMAADPSAEAAAQEAMEAEVASSGKVAQQQASNELRLDWITDATVTAPDGAPIGDINDLILDGETGEMIAAVIGVGGFLGIGEKQIAVPWDQLTVNFDAQEINSELTEEEAEAAPEYVFRERENAPAVAPAGDMAAPEAAPDAAMVPAADPATDPNAMPADGATGDGMGEPMETEPPMDGQDTMPAPDMEEADMNAEPSMEGGMAEEPATN